MTQARFDVTSFGEMLLRLSTPSGDRLEVAKHLDIFPAGAEANVLSLLARLNRKTRWAGALPRNSLGRLAANALRIAGVDTSGIIWNDLGRMGTYFVEFGAPPRGIQVTYDRAHSCITQLKPDEIDLDSLLDTRLLHLTGITPALSASCHQIILEASQQARQHGVPISFDVNYRQKLWNEADAQKTLLPLIQNIELLFCSANDAARLFNCTGSDLEISQQMLQLSHAKYVVITTGDRGALLWNGKEWLNVSSRATQIIDRLGAGDALAAGVMHGWLDNDLAAGLRYGVTLAALALSQSGDMVITNQEELLALSQSGGSFLTR
ncbi:MAG TPA: sugar kinase [Anaerolineales bacterium]|nr:sugar kinase [Anaerolineales bacterium]